MSIPTDISLAADRFNPANIPAETKKLNALLENLTTNGPRWYEVGVEKYRQMRETGDTPLPVPIYLPLAQDAKLPSRDVGRTIPVRIYTPDNGQPSKGIILHMHGGGFVLATHKHQDATLQRYANACNLTAISVGYRLAPEHPFPAAVHDCIDAAEHLLRHGGVPPTTTPDADATFPFFLTGESAGGCLATVTAFHLLRTHPSPHLAGLILPFAQFDLTLNLPSVTSFTRPLVINHNALERFAEAYTPGMTAEERRNPVVSPLYEDLGGLVGKLPPALFLCGTEDPLLDENLLMGSKWAGAGGEAVVRIWPGAPHGFTAFGGMGYGPGEEGVRVGLEFVRGVLERGVGEGSWRGGGDV